MNDELIKTISRTVAQAINTGSTGDLPAALNALFDSSATASEKRATLCVTPIYALVAEQPGYPADGKPGYLPVDADLKAAVLAEIDAMIDADFEKAEHTRAWQAIKNSVASAPETEFAPGIAVNCPDDYLLTLDRLFASEVLRELHLCPLSQG